MNLDAAIDTFVVESAELLERMELALLALSQGENNADLINEIFRAAHTIKGSGGVFGFDGVVAFTHVVENLLDRIRAGKQSITPDMINVLLRCCDHMRVLVQQAVDKVESSASEQDDQASLLAHLQTFIDGSGELPVRLASKESGSRLIREDSDDNASRSSSDQWHISVRFQPGVLRFGMDPLSFLRYMGNLGQVVDVVTLFDDQINLESLEPEDCCLGLEIVFRGAVSKQQLEEVFEFVREDCTLHILPPDAQISEYMALIHALPEQDLKLGEILVQVGALTRIELEQALRNQQQQTPDLTSSQSTRQPPMLGQVLVDAGALPEALVQAAALKQATIRKNISSAQKTLRVDADKLDELVNLVGELVVAEAGAKLMASENGDSALVEAMSILGRLVENIRDCALSLRMVQIGETFNRFQRVVHDVSSELGKDVRLVISGAETELDKTLIERIRDPLMHLVRNGIDHGLEDTSTRLAQGKPAQGSIHLNAFHDSGSIMIEVEDDGRGLHRENIRRKAIEKGLVREQDELSERDIYMLIFEPGFSTAAALTNLSGRGVGMDVVRREVEALRGTIDIQSREGQGTKISIRLPLTLAIITGFLFRVGSSHYVIPLDLVGECIESPRMDSSDESFMNLRGGVLPLLRLANLFQLPTRAGQRENVVVIQASGMRAGLVVNELLGEFQTVIKPLGKLFSGLRGIAGSTILGSGEVAIVLDPYDLIQAHILPQHNPLESKVLTRNGQPS